MHQITYKISNSIKFPFKDLEMVILIAILLFVIDFLNELTINDFTQNAIISMISHCLLFIELGYGSKIVYTSLKGLDNPPKLNKVHKIFFEGFKKSCIYFIYGAVLTFAFSRCKYYLNINMGLSIAYAILFLFVYITLIGGLLNRYKYRGKFTKAFNFRESYKLLFNIGPRNVLAILICALFAQVFVGNAFINSIDETSLIGACIFIILLIISPFALFSTKRLISLILRDIYGDNHESKN